jgi:ring-1,2-phenylacetyl-CoA epoxidase subunit PaaC
MTNISLDLIGQARLLFQRAAEFGPVGTTEDDLAYLRKENEYLNCLLVEQPNTDFAYTMARQFFYDVFNYLNLESLSQSNDETLAAIAVKSLKEVRYHLKFSSEWVLRLGDGTEESHNRIQKAINALWKYTGELFQLTDYEKNAISLGIRPEANQMQSNWQKNVQDVLQKATLKIPDQPWMQTGGKNGKHTEYMGFILTELQFMQRAYPGATW